MEIQTYLKPLQRSYQSVLEHMDGILIFSLWVCALFYFLTIITSTVQLLTLHYNFVFFILNFLCFLLILAQIITFQDRKKITWILSLIQVLAYVLYMTGTFTFIFTFVFSSMGFGYTLKTYLIAFLGISAELLKTLYFYYTCDR